MTTETIKLNLNQENIKYLSTDSLGYFIAITTQNKIIISGTYTSLELGFDILMAKIINEENILIVLEHSTSPDNALVVDYAGNCKVKFNIGTSINDIKINGKKIIVSYFDEVVLSGNRPDDDALAIFNLNGKQIFGFNSTTLYNQLIDCYCVANLGIGKIIFNGYGNFLLQELDLDTLNIVTHEIPPICIGARSISTMADNVIFHSTYKDKTSFFVWNLQSGQYQRVNSEFKNLQSTEHGAFYKVDKKSFTLAHPLKL